jgi:hypothetical protein
MRWLIYQNCLITLACLVLVANLWCMAKTRLKVLKDNCSRLKKSLLLEAFSCLEVWSLGHDGSVLLSVVTQTLLYNCCVQVSCFPLYQRCHWWLSVGSSCFYVLDSVMRPVIGVELPKKVFTSRLRWLLFWCRVKRFRKYVLSFEAPSTSQSCNL